MTFFDKMNKPYNIKTLILYSFIFWILWGSLIGFILYFSQASLGWDVALISTVLGNIIGWSFWGLVTPLILYLRKKFRFFKSTFIYVTSVHLLFSIIIGMIQTVYFGFFQSVIGAYFSHETFQQHINWYLQKERIFINGSLISVVYWLILGAGYLYEYYQDSMEKKIQNAQLEQQLSRAKLTALQYQLQPHFLFNTFHSISSLISQNENQTAISMITELSDLLRHSLKSGNTYEIQLRNEFELLNKYLDIIKIRFANKITINQTIDENTKDAYIPSFILQPLLENAVFHGVEQKASDGVISISCKKISNDLQILITDNGKGFDIQDKESFQDSIGLNNTLERLKTLYGEAYSFNIDSIKNEGTAVELLIPFHTEPLPIN